ncbi:MAG: GGDEF domain-containing protein [Gammaproteobacteria bacterium]
MNKEIFRQNREKVEATSRLVAGVAVTTIFWLGQIDGDVGSYVRPGYLQLGLLLYLFAGACIYADIWLQPAQNTLRNILSIALDVVGISGGLYMGAGFVDPVALFYLWVIVGSGLVYGTRYLFLATALAATGFGLVYLASPYWQSQPMFSATIAGLMLLLGPYLATLLVNLERAQRLVAWQADHDGLTEMLNRRAFERYTDAMIPAAESGVEHHLLYMDLDEFKVINDSAGHAAGDRALQDIARILSAHTNEHSLLARMGGDEFCLLLRDDTLENARRCAESIRSDIASYRLAWGTSYYTLGVSVGVVSSASSTDGDALVRLADAACYAAKNNGRNQVHVVDTHADDTDTQVIRRLRLPTPDTDGATATETSGQMQA